MSKGFALSLDAAFAVIVLVVFMATFSFLSVQATDDPRPLILLEKQANDVLIVMDKGGDFSSLNLSSINNTLNQTLPPSISRNMEIEYYNYSAGFVFAGNFSFGNNWSASDKSVVAQREFVTFENQNVKHYGVARLRLWVE